MFIALSGLGVNALNAPVAYAASAWYLHKAGSGNATIALVQSPSQTETLASTTIQVTFGTASTDGNALVAVGANSSSASVSSMSDSAGNLSPNDRLSVG